MSDGETVLLQSGSRRRGRVSLLLFVTLLVPYCFFVQEKSSWNDASRLALVRAIVEEHSLSIDRFHDSTGDKVLFKGHYYSDKAPGLSLFGVPVYFVLRGLFGGYSEIWTRYAITVVCVALPSAVAGVLMLHLLVRLRPQSSLSSNLFVVVSYSLGTIALPYSTVYFGHQVAAAALIAAFYVLTRVGGGERKPWLVVLAGFLTGLAALTEYPAAFAVPVFAAYAFFGARRKLHVLCFILGAIPPLACSLLYNVAVYGSPLAFSYRYHVTFGQSFQGGLWGLRLPSLSALYGLTINPYRGLFYLSPQLLLAFVGLHGLWRAGRRAELFLCAASFGVFFLSNASMGTWDGGRCLGPRYLLPAVPFLAVAGAFAYERWRAIFWGLAAVAFLFMFVGTAVEPQQPVLVNQPMLNLYLPLFAHEVLVPTLLSAAGVRGLVALVPLGLFVAAMCGLLARATKVRFERTGWARAGLAVGAAAAAVAVMVLGAYLNPEEVYRERGHVLYWAATWGHRTVRDAEKELLRARQLNPDQHETRWLLSEVYVSDLDEAIAAGDARRYQSALKAAIEELEAAVRIQPNDRDSLTLLARLYTYAGRAAEAEGALRRAAAIPDGGPRKAARP